MRRKLLSGSQWSKIEAMLPGEASDSGAMAAANNYDASPHAIKNLARNFFAMLSLVCAYLWPV